MIYTERKVTIKNDVATIDLPILLYRGDREVEIQFTIIDSKFKFGSNQGNVIDKTQATYGQLAVSLPNGTDLFTEIVECQNGAVVFIITGEMIDELHEVGFYSFHIRLYNDDKTSRITLPPVMKGVEIREPLIIEDDVENTDLVGDATVGYSTIQNRGAEEPVFDEEGNYIPTVWSVGDKITAERLNKVETGIASSKSVYDMVYVSNLKNMFSNDWDLLKYAMDNFENINIDIDLDVQVNESYDINHSIYLTGTGTITFSTSTVTNILCVNKDDINITIENIGLVLNFNGRLITGSSSNDGLLVNDVNLIKVDNCDITGNGILVLFYIRIAETEENIKKVKTSIFTNNHIHDLTMDFQQMPLSTNNNYQCYGLFLVENVSIDSIILNNNTIRNTARTIGQFKRRNSYTHKKGYIEVKHNYYKNDDTCWGRNDEQDAMYYVFVIAEGDVCVYEYNYVEGLKIKSYTITGGGRSVGTETYDVYTSVQELQCRNNITKNCMAFYTNDIKNSADSDLVPTIIKSKGSFNVCYENNKFIIEQSFIDANNPVGTDLVQEFIVIDNAVEETDSYDKQDLKIKNNLIKVPKLKFEAERTDFLGVYEFSDNVMECDTINGHVFYNIRVVGDRIFRNNKITATTAINKPFRIVKGESSAEPLDSTLYIENNTINVPNFYQAISGYNDRDRYTQYSKYKRNIIQNNMFYRRIYFKDCIGDIISRNNYTTVSETTNVIISTRTLGNTHIEEKYTPAAPFSLVRFSYGDQTVTSWYTTVCFNVKAVRSDGEIVELNKVATFNGPSLTVDGETTDLSVSGDHYLRFDDFFIRVRTNSTPLAQVGIDATSTGSGTGNTYIKADFEIFCRPLPTT